MGHEQIQPVGLGIFDAEEPTSNEPSSTNIGYMQQEHEEKHAENGRTPSAAGGGEGTDGAREAAGDTGSHWSASSSKYDGDADGETTVPPGGTDDPTAAQSSEQQQHEDGGNEGAVEGGGQFRADQEAAVDRIMRCDHDNVYEILGLDPFDTRLSQRQLKRTHRWLSILTNPKSNEDVYAAKIFHLVQHAYDTLRYYVASQRGAEDTDERDSEEPASPDPFDIDMETADILSKVRYGDPPRRSFSPHGDSMAELELSNWHKGRPGLNGDRRWLLDRWGVPRKDQYGQLIHRFHGGVKGVKSFNREGVSSPLRKSRRVNDLSPSSSPKELSPVSPIDKDGLADHNGAISPLAPGENESSGPDSVAGRPRAMSATASYQWDEDDEEADKSYLATPIDWNNINGPETDHKTSGINNEQVQPQASWPVAKAETVHGLEVTDGYVSDDEAQRTDAFNTVYEANDGDDEALPQVRTAAGTRPDSSTGYGEQQPSSGDFQEARTSSENDIHNQVSYKVDPGHQQPRNGGSEQSVQPAVAVDPLIPENTVERPSSRHGFRTSSSTLALETNSTPETALMKPSPATPGTLEGNNVSPESPTPSSASSIDSTTGMTQSKGLNFSNAYDNDPKPGLGKKRSQFVDNILENGDSKEKLVVKTIAEDPKDRIELLNAKVHKLKQRIGELEADLERSNGEYRELGQELDRARSEEDEWKAYSERVERDREEDVQRAIEEMNKRDEKIFELEQTLDTERGEYNALCGQYGVLRAQLADSGNTADSETQKRQDGVDKGVQTDGPDVSKRVARQHTVRWPPSVVDEASTHVADWINQTHRNERGPDIAPLTSEQVRDIFADGDTNFEGLVNRSQADGYVFRHDRFAQFIAAFLRERGFCSIQAMAVERGIERLSIDTTQLLEEIDRLLQDAKHDERVQEQQQANRRLNARNDDLRGQLYKKFRELGQCRAHGQEQEKKLAELTEDLEEHQQTLRELTEKSDSDGTPQIGQGEHNAFKDELAHCKQHGTQLQTRSEELEAKNSELETLLQEEKAAILTLTEKVDTASRELEAASALIEKLEAEIETLKAEADSKHSADNNIDGLQGEDDQATATVGELALEVKQLVDQREVHSSMLQAAREYIERLEGQAAAQVTAARRQSTPPSADAAVLPQSTPILSRTSEALPQTAGSVPQFPAQARSLQRRIQLTQAYQAKRDELRLKREQEQQQDVELRELQAMVHKALCGWETRPYKALAARERSLRILAEELEV